MTASEREALVKRVRAILAASEERDYDYISVNVDESDLRALCAEVERLTRERDAEREAREQVFAWYDERRTEVLRLTAEVERRREEVSVLRMFIGKNEVEEANEELANLDAARTTGGRDA